MIPHLIIKINCVLPECAPLLKFVISKHNVMIGCDRLYVRIQRVQAMLHVQNTRVKLDDPIMYRHGLATQETERSKMSHIVDMINKVMFTIEIKSTHVMIGLDVDEFGSWITRMTRGMSI